MSVQLKNLIQLIKNATQPAENTADRVGRTLELLDLEKADILTTFTKSEVMDLINQVKLLATSGAEFLGTITPSSVLPPSGNIWAFAQEGTYTNAGGIVVAQGELAIISRVNNAFTSVIIDIPIKSISSITKTGTVGLVDTYTIAYTDGTSTTFQVTNGESSNFLERDYSTIVDLTQDNFVKYTGVLGNLNFSEAQGSVFGKMSFYKLTGGSISFGAGFKEQIGSQIYNPELTNVITFWKEYDKVRYFIENMPFEPVPVDPYLVTEYSFIGTPDTLLKDILHTGQSALGATSGNKIIVTGQGISAINSNTFDSAFGFDLTGISNYKISLTGVEINGFIDVIFNASSVSDNSKDYITLSNNPARFVQTTAGTNSGFINSPTPLIGDLVFTVMGNNLSLSANGVAVFTDRSLLSGNGGFMGITLGDSGYSILKGLKIETL